MPGLDFALSAGRTALTIKKRQQPYVTANNLGPAGAFQMLAPPEAMQIVEPEDLKKFYLEGISRSTEEMVDAASARRRNLSMFEYLLRKATAPACAFPDVGRGDVKAG